MTWLLAGLIFLLLLVLQRAIVGPTVIDRIVAVGGINSLAIVILFLVAFINHDYSYIDVGLVFILCGFISNLWIIKVLVPGDWDFRLPKLAERSGNEEEQR
jgi:multisubunit Na+/H+ antiporter MnhF subunit